MEYRYDESSVHYYIAVVSTRSLDVNRLKFRITDFNVDHYDQSFLEVTAIPMEDLQLIVVKSFKDKKDAMDYYRA
ncbi:MAG: hypothetical protein J7L89_05400, partial [Bacteroidales bacterium]|nr:hypothetical protein [Bacteroidales bacterium]